MGNAKNANGGPSEICENRQFLNKRLEENIRRSGLKREPSFH